MKLTLQSCFPSKKHLFVPEELLYSLPWLQGSLLLLSSSIVLIAHRHPAPPYHVRYALACRASSWWASRPSSLLASLPLSSWLGFFAAFTETWEPTTCLPGSGNVVQRTKNITTERLQVRKEARRPCNHLSFKRRTASWGLNVRASTSGKLTWPPVKLI